MYIYIHIHMYVCICVGISQNIPCRIPIHRPPPDFHSNLYVSSAFSVVEPRKIIFLTENTIPQKEDIILLYIGYHSIPKQNTTHLCLGLGSSTAPHFEIVSNFLSAAQAL